MLTFNDFRGMEPIYDGLEIFPYLPEGFGNGEGKDDEYGCGGIAGNGMGEDITLGIAYGCHAGWFGEGRGEGIGLLSWSPFEGWGGEIEELFAWKR